jgi:hypothetical protein
VTLILTGILVIVFIVSGLATLIGVIDLTVSRTMWFFWLAIFVTVISAFLQRKQQTQ